MSSATGHSIVSIRADGRPCSSPKCPELAVYRASYFYVRRLMSRPIDETHRCRRDLFLCSAHGEAFWHKWELPDPTPARARLTIAELDVEFVTNNQAALDSLQAFNSALRKIFGRGS